MYGGIPPNNNPETSEGSTLSNSIEIFELSGMIKFEQVSRSMLDFFWVPLLICIPLYAASAVALSLVRTNCLQTIHMHIIL